MSVDLSKEYINKPKLNIALLIGSIIIVLFMVGFASNNIRIGKAESHARYYTDVADWVQDVESYVPDSEKRHTFVASVYAFVDDNIITDEEYSIIKDSYDDLKQSIALTSIHDNIKLMRSPNEFALHDRPAPLSK